MVDGGGTNTSKKYKNWFAMTDWAGGKVSEADQKKFLAYSIDSLAKFLGHVRKRDDRDTYSKSSSKLPFINPQTGQLHWYIPHFGDRSEVSESEEYFFNTDAVRFLAWLDSISNDKSPFQNDSDVEKLINQVFPSREPEYPFTDTALYETIGETLSLQSRVQANVVNLIKAKPLEEVKKEGEEVDKTGEAGQIARKVTTAGVPVGGGPAGEPAEGGGETGSASETGIQPPSATQPQPTDANRQPLVTDAERERRRMYGYESAWLTNTIITDLCRQHGIAETPALMASLHDVVYDSIGNMSQEELRGLFANTSGRLNQLKAIQLKLGGNVQFVQELNQLYDANYIALARIDETKAKAFREKTGYIPSKQAVETIKFASEEAIKKQLENPVDAGVNQTIAQLTGRDPLSPEQLQSLELVLTQLATGLGDKTLATELGIPINSNQLDIKEYIQSLDDLAIYRLIYGTKAKPDKAVLLKLRANLDQVKQNITSTCQIIITEKSIEFHADGFAKGASSHVSEVSRTGDLRESPLGDVANRLMPVMSGSLFAPEAVALVQSENRLSEASNDYKQFVKQFATTFNALDEDTQKMLILEAGVDPATVIGSDGKYIFDEQFMRAAGKLSKILRNANEAREIKRKVDARLAQSRALSKSEIDALAKMSGELKRLGLHAEADQLQNDLKKSFKDQLGTKQLMVYEHLEQLTIAERALNEAEFQVRMARTHANTHQALIQANQPATDTVSAYLTARSAAFAAGAAADQALKKIVDLPPDQKEIANELAEKRFRVEKQLSDLKSELGGIKTARDLSQNLSDEEYKKVFQEFANNPYYTDSQGNQREMWLPVSDEVFSGEYQEPSPIEPMGEAGSYDVQPAEFGWGMPASDFDLDYNDFVGGDEYADGGEDLVDQYNQTVEGAKRGGGKSNTRRLAGHIQKKVQAKRAAKKVAEQAAKKAVEGAAEAGSTVAGAASGPVGWAVKGALMAAKVANMLRTKEGRKKLGMYAGAIGGGAYMTYLALKGALGATAGGMAGALGGGALGAVIGSVVPGVGTLAGALIGGSIGAVGGYLNGGGSLFGLGGGGATTALPATPAYYSPSAPTFTPAASTTTLAPSQTMAGSGAGSPGLVDPAATAGTKTASMSQQAINDASARLSGQSPTSQLSAQPGGQWVDPSTGYRFDPNTGQVYDAAGQPIASAGSTITPGAAAGATAGAVGIAAVIGPLGLSGAAFFMPAISVLSVMFITLITIITIFAAFLTPTPGLFSDAGVGSDTSKYGSITKDASPTKLPNNHGTSEITYSIKLEPNPGYQWKISSISDTTHFLPPKQPNPIITYIDPQPAASLFPTDPFSDPQEYTYKATFVGGADVRVINRVVVKFQAVDRNGTVLPKTQTLMATAAVDIGNPKLGCFDFDTNGGVPIKADWNQNNDLDDDETLYSIPMGIGDQNAVVTAFMNRAGSNLNYYELVCSINDANPDGVDIKIHKFPNHPTQEYWGWVSASDFMVLYGPFYRAGPSSQEYTFIHELGHIIDQRHMPSLRNDFKRVWRSSIDKCFSYPFPNYCSLEEAFAEAIVVYVTGATTLRDWTPDGYPLKSRNPAVYNWVKENIFAGEEFYFKDM